MEENKSKKLSWLWIVLIVIVVGVLVGVFVPGSGGDVELVDAKMTCQYNSLMGGFEADITGSVQNNTNSDYSYVQIEFSVYDENERNLGTITDNMNNLAAGETWSFKATSLGWYDYKPVSFKLVEITYW
ncbi:MAG: hypothetical protein IJE91_03360 [Clostridia bacterium]|nr:hypothetical protein [Clostridia bacterium]